MGTKSVREIVESALRSHIAAQTELAGVNVYKGLEVAVDALPAIVVSCDTAGPIGDGLPGADDSRPPPEHAVAAPTVSNASAQATLRRGAEAAATSPSHPLRWKRQSFSTTPTNIAGARGMRPVREISG